MKIACHQGFTVRGPNGHKHIVTKAEAIVLGLEDFVDGEAMKLKEGSRLDQPIPKLSSPNVSTRGGTYDEYEDPQRVTSSDCQRRLSPSPQPELANASQTKSPTSLPSPRTVR